MKKRTITEGHKLAFNKERIANLSAAELSQIIGGGQEAAGKGYTSSGFDFTCALCTTTATDLTIIEDGD